MACSKKLAVGWQKGTSASLSFDDLGFVVHRPASSCSLTTRRPDYYCTVLNTHFWYKNILYVLYNKTYCMYSYSYRLLLLYKLTSPSKYSSTAVVIMNMNTSSKRRSTVQISCTTFISRSNAKNRSKTSPKKRSVLKTRADENKIVTIDDSLGGPENVWLGVCSRLIKQVRWPCTSLGLKKRSLKGKPWIEKNFNLLLCEAVKLWDGWHQHFNTLNSQACITANKV